MKPNKRLKYERERRGWSQGKVAEELGTTSTNISRWERGISFPYPYFREKLCLLFEKTVYDLGLLPDDCEEDIAHTPHNPTPQADVTLLDPAIPLPFLASAGLIGRDALLAQLQAQVCTNNGARAVGLSGLPGVGKTALATGLVHRQEVQHYFHDGILWAGLGPTPSLLGILTRWGALLGVTAHHIDGISICDAWVQALHTALGTRRMLLVLDDVWHEEDMQVLQVGGPTCVHLITTRFPALAVSCAGKEARSVPELATSDGIALLARFLPPFVDEEAEQIHSLVDSAGTLPLALTLMGRYLQAQAHGGQPRRVLVAMQHLQDAQKRLQLHMPILRTQAHPSLPHHTTLSLRSIIAVSAMQLDTSTRKALHALSVLPAKPDSFSEAIALAVTAQPSEILDALSDAGLLESHSPGRYMMHQTIADYARTEPQEQGVYTRLISFMLAFVVQHQHDSRLLTQESTILVQALEIAYEQNAFEHFEEMLYASINFLVMQGWYPLAQTHLQRAYKLATMRGDVLSLAKTLFHQGILAKKQGEYSHAEALLQEGTALARSLHENLLLSELLQQESTVVLIRGDTVQAHLCQDEALLLARQVGDVRVLCTALTQSGSLAKRQGEYEQAHSYYQEALVLARQLNHQELLARLLTELGTLADEQGIYPATASYYEEALGLARTIGDGELVLHLLTNMGIVADEQGEYEQAGSYYQEALVLARQTAKRPRIGALLINLGITTSNQGQYHEAEAYYQEGLVIARAMGHQLQICTLLVNMGNIVYQRGNTIKAIHYCQQALALAQQMDVRIVKSNALGMLGVLAAEMGKYPLAEAHLQAAHAIITEMNNRELMSTQWLYEGVVASLKHEYTQAQTAFTQGLQLTREVAHRELTSTFLFQLGELALIRHEIALAETHFREMLVLLPRGHRVLHAQALYGLARVALARGERTDARKLGKKSAEQLEEVGHRSRGEVKEWLAQSTSKK